VKVLLPLSCVLLLGAALWQLFVPEMPGIPWRQYNPFRLEEWSKNGAVGALVTQSILAIAGITLFGMVSLWVLYAAISGRNLKQRLTDPAPIDEPQPAVASS
jgi:hypothetical protein